MNKYHDAFNYLFCAVHINPSKETYNKNVQIIKELVEKETSVEAHNTGTEVYCPRCLEMFQFIKSPYGLCVTVPNYCPNCGQKLKCGDECE